MDHSRIKATIIKKYLENKAHLSKLDCWSFIDRPEYFTFKTSQTGFRYIKGNPEIKIIEEKVSTGKLAVTIEIEEIKLDNFSINKIDIVQDVEEKINDLIYLSAHFIIKHEFNTKNSLGNKDLGVFDIKCASSLLSIKIKTYGIEYIELLSNHTR